MKRWKVLHKTQDLKFKTGEFEADSIIKILLENRGLRTKKEINQFLHPNLSHVTADAVEIDKKQLGKAIKRIKQAIQHNETIVIYGDYDVDGICGTAVLWETLYAMGAKVMPYIPHRIDEGYGLSVKGISNVKLQNPNVKLIITVDNGIVASEAVEYANKQEIDVIITDHHVLGKTLPDASAIVHTTKLCGAGVAWALAQELKTPVQGLRPFRAEWQNSKLKTNTNNEDNHLELVALATIADLVLLLGANRTLVKFGLEKLHKTKRPGLIALYQEAGIIPSQIGVYEVGHIIAPRLNAMGRLEYAMDSLRLLCTKDLQRAQRLAEILGKTNRERQQVTEETAMHAKLTLRQISGQAMNKLLFIADESYQQGVIGLVAGKLVEEYYRPSIVVAIGKEYSKASARSVNGFNIIEFIRSASELLVDAGGHPMAAGFTVETAKLTLLQEKLEQAAQELLDEEKLTRELRIDCELPFDVISGSLYQEIQTLSPFGMGNPEPTFVSRKVTIEDIRLVGNGSKHLKCNIKDQRSVRSTSSGQEIKYNAIGFGLGEKSKEFHRGDTVDIVYVIDKNTWNGNRILQLKIKDVKSSNSEITRH